jgi:hypothetical protein
MGQALTDDLDRHTQALQFGGVGVSQDLRVKSIPVRDRSEPGQLIHTALGHGVAKGASRTRNR